MPRKSLANLENAVMSRHFAEEQAAMTPPPKSDERATPADLDLLEFEQIALAKRCYAEHRAAPEQIRYLRKLKLI